MANDVAQSDLRCELAILLHDRIEHLLRVADQIHLVDREHDMTNAEQRDDVAVTARLRQHALARVDQDHGDIRRRRAR